MLAQHHLWVVIKESDLNETLHTFKSSEEGTLAEAPYTVGLRTIDRFIGRVRDAINK